MARGNVSESPTPLGPGELQGNTAFVTSVALLMLRLALGWTFIFHGSQLAFGAFGGPGPEGFAKGLAGLPILPPLAWAYIGAYGQLIGGVTVFVGLLARLGTLPIIASMVVAILTVHAKNGFAMLQFDPSTGRLMTDSVTGMPAIGYEYNFNLIAMCLTILLAGPGIISLDALIFKRGLFARGAQPLGGAQPRG
jgi:putative oxidoreductase